jgi:hypothetical protein
MAGINRHSAQPRMAHPMLPPEDPMIYANCRDRFTAEDFDFIVQSLARSGSESISLAQLLTDAETRDAILDQDRLVQAILSQPAQLRISPQFYFYVLIRHVLKSTVDRRVCDYIAALLEEFSRTARMRSPADGVEGPLQYLCDMLLALRTASARQSFLIQVHVGNYSLFITGIFKENIERRSARGAPHFSFYEQLGRANFHAAAKHSVARQCELHGVYEQLADEFRDIRLGLNRLAEEMLNLDPHIPLP